MRILGLPLILLCGIGVRAQQPLLIKGQWTHYSNEPVVIFYNDINGMTVTDTLFFDQEGRFQLSTHKLTRPQVVSLQNGKLWLDLAVAPGYALELDADARDRITFLSTYTIKGKGAAMSEYWLERAALESKPPHSYKARDSSMRVVKDGVTDNTRMGDSLIRAVFDNQPDRFEPFFKKVAVLDNRFRGLSFLLEYIDLHNPDPERRKTLFDNASFTHMDDSVNLCSDEFNSAAFDYLNYLLHLDAERDNTTKPDMTHLLNKIMQTFSGPVRTYILYQYLDGTFDITGDISTLKKLASVIGPYIDSLHNETLIKDITGKLKQKELAMTKIQPGLPAPSFTMKDSSGRTYQLSDFRGKVVYLDFWASWCGPCRAETPYLVQVQKTYKDNKDVVFISVSVEQSPSEWRQALREDHPGGLQLYDDLRKTNDAYDIVALPTFMIIDQKGILASTDAPRPDNPQQLTAALGKLLQH
jgi:thiol-disulfide isomerase/thioredoxin